jgi:RNA recognition motif-containing protein
MLVTLFQPYGVLLEVKIMRDQQGRSKGCAWVRYETQEQAQRAIEALHEKHTIPPQTNTLRVQYALRHVVPNSRGGGDAFARGPATPLGVAGLRGGYSTVVSVAGDGAAGAAYPAPYAMQGSAYPPYPVIAGTPAAHTPFEDQRSPTTGSIAPVAAFSLQDPHQVVYGVPFIAGPPFYAPGPAVPFPHYFTAMH